MSNRGYPEVTFVETNPEVLINSLIAAYELMTGRTLYPASPERIFILWVADVIIQQRILVDESAKQNIPRYAKGIYLDSVAEIFKDAYRLEAEAARATFRCYITKSMSYDIVVPKGTRITVDGDITFETTEELKVKAGKLYGDVEGICQRKGLIGDGFTPGQITQLIDLYDYYDKVENITTSSGGAEEEEDDAFYQRMRESVESFSTAGPEGAYKYHAKTASPLVADVEVDSTEAGVVDVCVLLQDGAMPTEEVLEYVKEALSSKEVRPLTDSVRVSAPQTVEFDVELTYYIPKDSQNSTNIIKEDVEKAIDEYISWQTEKMGRDINPSRLISLIMSKGAKRVDVTKPTFKTINTTNVAKLVNKTVINGGVEDE